jgi:hypothetical protein
LSFLAAEQKRKLTEMKTISYGARNLLDFCRTVTKIARILWNAGEDVDTREFVILVVSRLPVAYRSRLTDALRLKKYKGLEATLEELRQIALTERANEKMIETYASKEQEKKKDEKKKHDKKKDEKGKDEKKNGWQKKDKGSAVNSYTTTTQLPTGGQLSSEKNCYECGGQHDLADCTRFQSLPLNERLRKAKDVFVHIYFRCLKKHRRGQCEFTPECPVEGKKCRYTHHALLHGTVAAKPEKKKEEIVAATTDVSVLSSQAGEQSLRLVKLYVRACDGNKKTICHVTALLDSGSSTTILREEVARQLGARLNFKDIAVTTLHGTNTEKMASLKLQVSPNCKEWHDVNQAKMSTKFRFGDTQLQWSDYVRQDPVFKGVDVGDYNYNNIDLLSAGMSSCSSYHCTAKKTSGWTRTVSLPSTRSWGGPSQGH